jgi:folate-binding Fe-S cluster repair protein YgfZ
MHLTKGSRDNYTMLRYRNGIAEGSKEFMDGALPLEYNADLLNGGDLRYVVCKAC